jgi:hypothetical protein
MNEGARAGLASALKARHRLFGFVLQFLLQLDRFRAWVIWLFLLEMFLGLSMADEFSLTHPDWSVPILLVEAVFFSVLVLVCVAQPLFDLVLRLDREGRRALTAELEQASNWSALCLLAALGLGAVRAGRATCFSPCWRGPRCRCPGRQMTCTASGVENR